MPLSTLRKALSGPRSDQLIRGVLIASACLLLTARVWYGYDAARNLFRHVRDRPYAAFFSEGLVDAVSWLKQQGYREVFGLHWNVSPYLYQRLSEMLYPLPYRPYEDESELPAGAVTVVLADHPPRRPHRVLRTSGVLKIVRMEP